MMINRGDGSNKCVMSHHSFICGLSTRSRGCLYRINNDYFILFGKIIT